jgi:hypothetical protein
VGDRGVPSFQWRLAKKPTESRRKLIEFDAQTWHALNLLSRESMKNFQELADEVFRDLLQKYGRPAVRVVTGTDTVRCEDDEVLAGLVCASGATDGTKCATSGTAATGLCVRRQCQTEFRCARVLAAAAITISKDRTVPTPFAGFSRSQPSRPRALLRNDVL